MGYMSTRGERYLTDTTGSVAYKVKSEVSIEVVVDLSDFTAALMATINNEN